MSEKKQFTFEISLSVLNHLGRQLYRSFATVLGEAISNSWDADAKNVWIYIDRKKNSFVIKDDGVGMTPDDFQNKFLKIGYSKRKDGETKTDKGRPFIGRKGIGKLALLSCADKISVISKTKGEDYTGGTIDNSGLDKAITQDLTPQEYPLGKYDISTFSELTQNHEFGTIIYFQNLKDGIRNTFEFLSKTIALYFRFSLLDKSFSIYLDGQKITHEHLSALAEKTQFLWKIGKINDPYVDSLEAEFSESPLDHEVDEITFPKVHGFIGSVHLPRHLKILTIEDRVGIDLFVNGRLRERDVLKHIPTQRVVESYLYGQIHFNTLDDTTDRFTSSREGIVADDPKYKGFLEDFRKHILKLNEQWDEWRRKHRDPGDLENTKITPKARASQELFGAISKEFADAESPKKRTKVDDWFDELNDDATFNFESYAECFVSENLVRKYIAEKKITLSPEAQAEAKKWKGKEVESKNRGNISIEIRRVRSDLNYLDMDNLANLVDKPKDRIKEPGLARDATEYKPIRDAVAHTALLTDEAKKKLTSVRENIKARVKTLLAAAKS
jgi:Histidine kinase-, DNA gyrase B-, and HSP90-like ATPase